MNIEEAIIEFTNEDTGMRALVVANSVSGFNVVLQDIDSGEYVPFVTTYPTLVLAGAKAAEVLIP